MFTVKNNNIYIKQYFYKMLQRYHGTKVNKFLPYKFMLFIWFDSWNKRNYGKIKWGYLIEVHFFNTHITYCLSLEILTWHIHNRPFINFHFWHIFYFNLQKKKYVRLCVCIVNRARSGGQRGRNSTFLNFLRKCIWSVVN